MTIEKEKVVALLDGGSGINSVTEEMLIGMLNKCWDEGIQSSDKEWLVVQLEKWINEEMVMGIAAGTPLKLSFIQF